MFTLKKLPSTLIDQIAAGEVVESPVSVVKELVENAIDAGAKKIAVNAEGDLLQHVSVMDNGKGMSLEEMLLAAQRHTTSKIASESDLVTLSTMGFRGEALSSIFSIANVEMESAKDQSGSGFRAFSSAGTFTDQARIARRQGTTIHVRDLFFNTPARKAFQKTGRYLRSQLIRLVQSFSLAFPEREFSLVIEGKTVVPFLKASGASFLDRFCFRMGQIYGEPFVDKARRVEKDEEGLKIVALLGPASYAKAGRSSQHIFINGRWIQSPFLSSLVKELYSTRLEEKEHPAFALHINLDPSKVDVNVHPQKKEVRFQDERFLRKRLLRLLDVDTSGGTVESLLTPQPFSNEVAFSAKAPKLQPEVFFKTTSKEDKPVLFQESRQSLHYMMKVGSYALVASGQELWIMSGKEALMHQMIRADSKRAAAQKLLVPHVFTVTLPQEQLAVEMQASFANLGIEVRVMGLSLSIDAIPPFFSVREVEELLLFFLENGKIGPYREIKLEKKFRQFTSRKTFSEEELRLLAGRYQEPIFPVFVKVQENDLETWHRGG
ncbi:MAG: DNA mismatch repair endonuclease MutL [Chlamydiota bacterium]